MNRTKPTRRALRLLAQLLVLSTLLPLVSCGMKTETETTSVPETTAEATETAPSSTRPTDREDDARTRRLPACGGASRSKGKADGERFGYRTAKRRFGAVLLFHNPLLKFFAELSYKKAKKFFAELSFEKTKEDLCRAFLQESEEVLCRAFLQENEGSSLPSFLSRKRSAELPYKKARKSENAGPFSVILSARFCGGYTRRGRR